MFLHAVEEGPATQSYGLQVAQLAGVPAAVIRAARKHLAVLESQAAAAQPQGDLFSIPAPAAALQEPPDHPALEQLRNLQPDGLSPREALELLYSLSRLARDSS